MSTKRQATKPPGELIRFASETEFEAWLKTNHDTHLGIWLKLAKKGVDPPSVSYAQALEVALCFGWIDGQKAAHDDRYWLQRFTPRSSRSRWSQTNREKAEQLISAGRMQPAGLAEIERAIADGRWNAAYAGQRNATVPDDLQRELEHDPRAAAAFSQLDAHNRYAIIWRINDAKRPETRARRIAKYVDMLRRGERIHG
ncbi:MAG: YdeI/OmpD-associated family protein [Solirubrobacterales bacterium]|nr:YdeI/OmpD-associated family protein [Solirubrobacterales bacterium]